MLTCREAAVPAARGSVALPSLEFKGKQYVYAHHLTVPYRPLTPDPARSVAAVMDSAPPPRYVGW